METFADKLRAFGLALAVHAVCILAMLIGLWWTTEARPVSVPGPVIQVDLIGPTQAPKSVAVASVKAPPKPVSPKPEPPKPDVPKPEPAKIQPPQQPTPPPTEVQQDKVDQERIAALAAEKAAVQKEQEEKHKQQQALLEDQQRKEEERKKQLADVRKQREAAEKALKLEQQKLAQLEDRQRADRATNEKQRVQAMADREADQAQTGAGGQDDDLSARYAAAIQSAVTNNWNRPDSAQAGLRCTIIITQIPGGDLLNVSVSSPCNADQVTRNSIESAVRKAAPLPYKGYEKVFQRSIRFNFRYDG
jgi:colicin import membrane protein